MKQRAIRLLSVFLALLLVVVLSAAWAEGSAKTTTILFTHDLHSHFLPQVDSQGGESGGYARLKTAIDQEKAKNPRALLVDGGDFSIGSLIQTLYTTQAPELRTMGAMGYDAVTVGNHEFDHEGTGFAQMLQAASASGDKLPSLLMANYQPAPDNPDRLDIQRAMASCGVRQYMLLERGNVTYGIFGLMGTDSDDCAPTSGFVLEDPAEAAQRCVDTMKEQGAQFIIALSHSGTSDKRSASEDEQLAKKVSGIDLIVSGHTHSTLDQPIVVGSTYIVSAGPYCQNLGSITLKWTEDGEKTLVDYHLTPIDETLPKDQEIDQLIDRWKSQVSGSYLGAYGLSYDQVLVESNFDLPLPKAGVQIGNGLGELVADAFYWAARQELGDEEPIIAITADGVLRAPLYQGDITTSMAFDVLSMGVGQDGTSGFPLVSCYLTGAELKAVAEVDASVTPLMPAAQLYMSGMDYSFNVHRMPFNRVTNCRLVSDYNSYELEDDKLYRVVSGMYSAQMLGTVEEKSMGLLSLTPKDAQGQPITDFTQHILYDRRGNELKEWYALASYLGTFESSGLPLQYAQPDGRKAVSHSWNPIALVRSPNWITLTAVLLLTMVVLLAAFIIRQVLRAKRRRRYGKSKPRFFKR
ncbi:MAG: bifunctional metallophosphatase/5'-nucleotidase [Oscillospiraceae bacterium]|jgi:5'-nucleotidase/UDP-sugar diphosphatase|nr:bifunctional metallophosphatase/5'-nucleotidase [Oscillospiraceae bacterium]